MSLFITVLCKMPHYGVLVVIHADVLVVARGDVSVVVCGDVVVRGDVSVVACGDVFVVVRGDVSVVVLVFYDLDAVAYFFWHHGLVVWIDGHPSIVFLVVWAFSTWLVCLFSMNTNC